MRLTATATAITAGIALATAVGLPARAADTAPKLSAEEANSIAADAYVYFYPLVTMDVTRQQLTNMPEGSGIGGITLPCCSICSSCLSSFIISSPLKQFFNIA